MVTLRTRMYEKLSSSESTEAWMKLGKAVVEYDTAQFIADLEAANAACAKAFG